jgi:cell division septum initiation protein DivIVA
MSITINFDKMDGVSKILKHDIDKAHTFIDVLVRDYHSLDEEINDLRKKNKALEKKIESINMRHTDQISNLRDWISRFNDKIISIEKYNEESKEKGVSGSNSKIIK